MWEAIEKNRSRSRWLISLMGAVLVALGFAIGMIFDPGMGGAIGAGAALVLWLVMLTVALASGDKVLLLSSRAHRIERADAPQLWNVVEEMTIASGLGTMPKVYVIDDSAPNAFAVGRRPENAAVAVTSGLLRKLNRDELQGVVAHELGHIRNLDVRFMTIAGVMLGTIVLLSDLFLRSLWFGAGRRRSSSRGGGQAQLVFLVIAILAAILAPIAAHLLYLACSRKREYLADASAARFTRYPPGLASALQKISGQTQTKDKVNRALAPMYIVNPLKGSSGSSWWSTHPPAELRVRILRGMAGGAGFADYEASYRKALGKDSSCVGTRTLEEQEKVAIRKPSPKSSKKDDAIARARGVADLLGRFGDFLLLTCACGVRIKIPPDLPRETIPCPRCGKVHTIPRVEESTPTKPDAPSKMTYRRRGEGWESFKCRCGHPIQLSPSLEAKRINCSKCNTEIELED